MLGYFIYTLISIIVFFIVFWIKNHRINLETNKKITFPLILVICWFLSNFIFIGIFISGVVICHLCIDFDTEWNLDKDSFFNKRI